MADICDAVCWLKDGHWIRRASWSEGNYLYMQDGVVHVHVPGAGPSSSLLATGEDLLADDWELPSDLRVGIDQMQRGETVPWSEVRAEEMLGRELTWSDEQPPEGSVVADRYGRYWHSTGSPMGDGEMSSGGSHWQIDLGDDRWSDAESWTRVCEFGPVTVHSWGY